MDNKAFKVTLIAMCIVFNIIGGFIAITMKLPVYLDTIGTFLSAFLFGPIAGISTGAISSFINGITFDPISLYFIPVQVIVGFMGGMLFKKGLFNARLITVGIIIVTITSSIVASIISAYVFGGITSSGSSIVVMYLKELGVNIITSIFSTQILTDLLDKSIVISLVMYLIKIIPLSLKRKYFKFNNKDNESLNNLINVGMNKNK